MKLLIGHVGQPLAGKETVSKIIVGRAKQDGFTVGWIQFRDPLQETFKHLNTIRERNVGIRHLDWRGMRTIAKILEDAWDISITPPDDDNYAKFVTLIAANFPEYIIDQKIGSIPINRPHLQKLPVSMCSVFGEGALSHAVFSRAKKHTEDIVQVDGIRWLSDEKELRAAPNALMLYTTASFNVRALRAKKRKKEGEELKTIEQLREEERAENECHIADIGSRADWTIVNESDSLKILTDDIEQFYRMLVLPRLISEKV